MSNQVQYYDIASNLCDDQFYGIYHHKKYHEPDHLQVVQRAQEKGVTKMLFTSGTIEDFHKNIELCQKFTGNKTTIGIHPCMANSFPDTEQQFKEQIETLIEQNLEHICAIGECGLDYDWLFMSTKEQQLKAFIPHLKLAHKYNLPLYLHSRNCEEDFIKILKENREYIKKGVVHSFTGTKNELRQILDLGLDIGINGTSLKTEEGLQNLQMIPLNKLHIETDAPYCEIKPSHASYKYLKIQQPLQKPYKKYDPSFFVKNWNEPSRINEVVSVISEYLQMDIKDVCEQVFANSVKIFG